MPTILLHSLVVAQIAITVTAFFYFNSDPRPLPPFPNTPPETCIQRATLADIRAYAGSDDCPICLRRLAGINDEEESAGAAPEDDGAETAPARPDDDGGQEEDQQARCEEPSKLVCGHVFGRECLVAWLPGKWTCPLCRRMAERVDPEGRLEMDPRMMGWEVQGEAGGDGYGRRGDQMRETPEGGDEEEEEVMGLGTWWARSLCGRFCGERDRKV